MCRLGYGVEIAARISTRTVYMAIFRITKNGEKQEDPNQFDRTRICLYSVCNASKFSGVGPWTTDARLAAGVEGQVTWQSGDVTLVRVVPSADGERQRERERWRYSRYPYTIAGSNMFFRFVCRKHNSSLPRDSKNKPIRVSETLQ